MTGDHRHAAEQFGAEGRSERRARRECRGDVLIERLDVVDERALPERDLAAIGRREVRVVAIDFELPMAVQRVHASDAVISNVDRNNPDLAAPDRGKVALRYGPLVYNIEALDQDITATLAPGAPLTAAFRPELLGGVTVITGHFADGSPLVAVPNFARYNRYPPAPPPAPVVPRQPPPPPAPRPPAQSLVWMREA